MARKGDKPLDYVLCEGASDANFVSLYIERLLQYVPCREKSRQYIGPIQGCAFFYLEGPHRDVLICSCGGCHNVAQIYQSVVLPSLNAIGLGCRIDIILDRDEKTDAECLALAPGGPLTMEVNKTHIGSLSGNFFTGLEPNLIPYESYFAVVPTDCSGAFENVLIQAIAQQEPEIVNEAQTFLVNLSPTAKRHIGKTRLAIKAELDIILTLLDPERFYQSLKDAFALVDLDCPIIKDAFGFLAHLERSL